MRINEPLISIIILNYNSGILLSQCVESILKSNYTNYEIIVVDNASNDNSHTECKKKFQKVFLIENKENQGYCKGNNIGLEKANGDFIIILNPDTTVDKHWIEELINGYNKFGEGLYQPKLLAMDDTTRINSAGNMIHIFGFGFSRGRGEKDDGQYNQPQKIGYPSGACLFTSRETIKKIGNFDTFLFAYHDDLDLGWRAAKIGIDSYYIPSAIVYHKESFSFKWSSKKFYLLERNRHYCLLTNYSRKTYNRILLYLILTEMAILFFYIYKGFLREKISAYIDIIKNKKYIESKHRELEEKRKFIDKHIIEKFVDEIIVPKEVSSGMTNKYFNKFLSLMSKYARKRIQHDK